MFGFLKEKLKSAINKLTGKVAAAPEKEIEVKTPVEVASKVEEKPKVEAPKPEIKAEIKVEKPVEKPKEEIKPKVEEAKPKVVEKPAEIKKPEIKVEKKVEEAKPKFEEVKPKAEAEKPKVVEKKIEEAKLKIEEKPKVEARPKIVEVPKVQEKPRIVEAPKAEAPKPFEKSVENPKEEAPKKKGFFSFITEKITTKIISPEQFDELFWDLELAMLENNVAVEVIEKIKTDLKTELTQKPVPRARVEETVINALKKSIGELFDVEQIDLIKKAKEKKPFVICFVGVNGSGKTTSIAKVAHMLLQNKLSVVLAAADTFRAAAIDQLQLHADKLGVKLIKHDYGADAAAVAFDAVKHAEAKHKDVVLIDTAGRLHSDHNLVEEMKKIVRVSKPDMVIFVGESITGNDCVEQAKQFDAAVGISGIILAKADVDEKGGAAISVSYVTKKPILYMGTGQEYKDLEPFDKDKIIASMGL